MALPARIDIPAEMAALMPPETVSPWGAADSAFRVVVGRESCVRWASLGSEIEDALVCHDTGLLVAAMVAAGYDPETF